MYSLMKNINEYLIYNLQRTLACIESVKPYKVKIWGEIINIKLISTLRFKKVSAMVPKLCPLESSGDCQNAWMHFRNCAFIVLGCHMLGLSWWFSGKESACQCKRCRRCWFDPWVRKILWRRKWQPVPVFLPRKIPWTEELADYSPWGHERVRDNLWLNNPSATSHVHCNVYFFIYFLFVVNFVIHWNETAMGLHVFPIPIPPPTSLSTHSL